MDRIFHGRNLRKARISIPNQIYLVTAVTQSRRPVFQNFTHARILIQTLHFQDMQNNCQTLAFVIMPDHFHWLLTLKSLPGISRIMQSVKRHSARQINLNTGNTNRALWQNGFHDHAIRKEEDLKSIARYIVANPLRAGLVERISDYPHWDTIWIP